jgi:uncharacterized protein YciI
MATFAVICMDKPGGLAVRVATRADHLAFIAANGEMVRLAGPFLDPAGEMCGSMLVVEAETLAAVESFCAADPYARAGLFEAVQIRPWRVGVGKVP